MNTLTTLTLHSLDSAVVQLAELDPVLERLYQLNGIPPMWERSNDFATLIHIILEQQVSLASGMAVFNKLKTRINPFDPGSVLTAGETEIRACGVTRQKTRYILNVAGAVAEGSLDFKMLGQLSDVPAAHMLEEIKGVGPWTSAIFLIMALRRPDVWPRGDLALAIATTEAYELEKRPSYADLEIMAKRWKPFRAVAARLLWHYYLIKRGRQ